MSKLLKSQLKKELSLLKSKNKKALNTLIKKEIKQLKINKKISRSLKNRSRFTKKLFYDPTEKRSYEVQQKYLNMRTNYSDNSEDIFLTLESIRDRLISELSDMKKNEGLAIGYKFKFKFDPLVYDDNIVSQKGFSSRVLIGKNGLNDQDLSNTIEYIISRFDVYINRKYCQGVKLDSLIIEKIPKQTFKAEKKRKPERQISSK